MTIVARCKVLHPSVGNRLQNQIINIFKFGRQNWAVILALRNYRCLKDYLYCTCSWSLASILEIDVARLVLGIAAVPTEPPEGARRYMIWEKHVSRSRSNSLRRRSYACELPGVCANPTPM